MLGILKDVGDLVVRRLQDRLAPPSMAKPFEEPLAETGLAPSGSASAEQYAEQFAEEGEVERLERKCQEYFEVIERIERERDEMWRMYRTQVAEHLNGQGLLLKERARLMVQLSRAVKTLNRMRKEQGLEPIKGPGKLDPLDEISQTAERYIEDMVALCRSATKRLEEARPPFVSGEQQRERIRQA